MFSQISNNHISGFSVSKSYIGSEGSEATFVGSIEGDKWSDQSFINKVAIAVLIVPVGSYYAVKEASKFVFKKILKPIGSVLKTVCVALFIKFPNMIYENALVHIGRIVTHLAKCCQTSLSPIGKAILSVARAVFVRFPIWIFNKSLDGYLWVLDRVLRPATEAIKNVAFAIFFNFPHWIYCKTLKHAVNAAKKVAKWVFNKILKPGIEKLIFAAVLSYKEVLAPLGRAIKRLAQAVFVQGIYKKVLKPIKKAIMSVAGWVYEQILTRIGHAILAARTLVINASKRIYHKILKPISRAVVFATDWIYRKILTPLGRRIIKPIGTAIKNAALFTYNQVLKPAGQTIHNMGSAAIAYARCSDENRSVAVSE